MMRIRVGALLLAIAILAALPARSQTGDLEKHLRDACEGKTLLLRGFYSGSRLHYDSSGNPIPPVKTGDWTSDGYVQIARIYLSNNRLKVEGRRLFVVQLEGNSFRFLHEETPEKRAVEIEADLSDNPAADTADSVLRKIFLTAHDDVSALVPDYWKPCVRANLRFFGELASTPDNSAPVEPAQPAIDDAPNCFRPEQKKDHITASYSRPKPIYSPDPEYSERARHEHSGGKVLLTLVVDEKGLPEYVRIVKPLGLGLDEQAIACIQKWKFKPAEKDGLPVAAQLNLEVEFHTWE